MSTRVLLMLGITMSILLGGLLWMATAAFKKDKLSYIYDLQDLQSETLAVRLRADLERASGMPEPFVPPSGSGALRTLGLPRLPEKGEIFLAHTTRGQRFLIERKDDGSFVRRPFLLNEDKLPDPEYGLTYWLTSYGELVGSSHRRAVNETNFANRAAVQEFLKSGLTAGLVTVRDKKFQVIGGFREVPETNLVVFVETSLDAALLPLQRFLRAAILLGLGVILAGVALAWVILRALWQPVQQVGALTSQIAQGQYDVAIQHPYRDEFHFIFQRLTEMAGLLKAREGALLKLRRNLEEILGISLEMALVREPYAALGFTARAIAANVESLVGADGYVALLDESLAAGSPLPGEFQIAERGVLCLTPRTPSTAQKRELEKLGLRAVVEQREAAPLSEDSLRVPVFVGGIHAANVLFRAPVPLRLSPMDNVFLETAATSLGVAFENLLLRESVADKVRIDAELQTAQAVQANLLPMDHIYPGVDIAAHYSSAEQTGGDWFGFYFDDARRTLYFYVGDVTGHGVGSALLTGVACGAVYACEYALDNPLVAPGDRQNLTTETRLFTLTTILNRVLRQTGRGNFGMTMAFMSLNVDTGELSFVSAGHLPPYWIKASERKLSSIPNRGSVLGFSDEGEFNVKNVTLAKGDVLLLYTDGLVENQGPGGETLKLKPVMSHIVREFDDLAPQKILTTIRDEAVGKWREHPAQDDVTMFALRWHGDT